jgi:anti-sigma-K factor RskA
VNPKEFIESGILESYIMGIASEQDRLEVERMAANYPEIQEELAAIERSMEMYSKAHSTDPPVGLKDEIWSKLKSESTTVIPMAGGTQRNWSFWQVAAIILLSLSAIFNMFLYKQLGNVKQELSQLNDANQFLAAEIEAKSANYSELESTLAAISNPNSRQIALAGVNGHDDAKALIFWNEETGSLYFQDVSLPNIPTDRQYQLWAIVDGTPVDAGLLQPDAGNLTLMKSFPSAQAFAITVEPKGGSISPTLEAMVVMAAV